jgi:5'-AMP-activated protein kinase beta subunit, interaction domain
MLSHTGCLIAGPEKEVEKEVWTTVVPEYIVKYLDPARYNGHYVLTPDVEVCPPALPRQLEKPFLNQNHIQKDDQSVLPNPAHVSTITCRLTTGGD